MRYELLRRPLSALIAASALGVATYGPANAAKPEDAPEASREQVKKALVLLAPAFSPVRSVSANAPGTIEDVIAKYAPLRFHPVAEGALGTPRKDASCPPEMALVAGRVCVDRFEGSISERAKDGSLVDHPHYLPLESGHVYVARSIAGVYPQSYLSGAQAKAACAEAKKRLCEPVEWRAACGGRDGFAYPYGKAKVKGTCHDSGAAPMVLLHPEALKTGLGLLELNDPRANQLPNSVAKTGAYPSCVNDYGIFDMVGNVHEWTADPNGTFQGGYWLDTAEHGDGCAYRTIAHPFDYHDYSTGFRCCADPKTGE